MKTRYIKGVLTLLMLWVALPMAADDYLKIYFKDGHTERHYLKLVENITVTKYDLEGNLHSDYQMQQIVMADTTYSYYLADIDSMSFKKVYEEQVKNDIETVTSGAEAVLQSCHTVEEMEQHLEELQNLEGVESVSMIPSGVVIQVRDWRKIFYIIPPEYLEEDDEQQYNSESLARLKLLENRAPMTSSFDSEKTIKVALVNKLHGDVARMGQQSAMMTLDLELKRLGFESQYIDNVDLKFFLEDIYEYDHIILLTHGIYYTATGVHHLATDTKIHKSESGYWVLDPEEEALIDKSDLDELGIYTAELGGINFAYYATVSENFINKRVSKMEHQKPSIFFNGACLSLYGNDILERSVEPYKVRGNDNLAKALCKENSFDIYIGYTDENHRGILGGVNLFENMLNGQSEEVAFSNIKPKYLYDNYLFNQAYLTEVCYDSNPQTSPKKSFLVKTKTKEMSALDIVAYNVDGKIRLTGTTTMLSPENSTVKCGIKYAIDGVDYPEIFCEKEYNGGELKEDNVSFSTTIDSPSGQNLVYRAFTYDGMNYNWGEERSFKISSQSGDSYTTCPDNNHPHMIDLGLPSGTKWACCNVGATTPEGYGDYFAWGETQTKNYYAWSTYIHCDGTNEEIYDISSDIAGTQYDAATANWGAPWQMPSQAQCEELINNCTSVWTTQNGINGRKFTGANGGTLFLPAAGFRGSSSLDLVGSRGYYWSSSLHESDTRYAWDLYFLSGNALISNDGRIWGQSVRAVTSSGLPSPSINVTTLSATDVSVTSATLNGSVAASNTNKSYEAGFFLSTTSSSPSSTDYTKNVTCSSSSPVGNFSASATGLSAGTKYNYRAYVLYDGKYYYGDTKSFTTSSSASYTSCPDDNHPHMIDLGLPSGTKWACCNVGATTPEGYGDYFAWGETQPKDNYDWSTYIHCDGSEETCHDIGSDIAGTQYDAATANWGAPWSMPTLAQCRELINNCTSVWTTQNGIIGSKFTGPNGSAIFLPTMGYRWDGELGNIDLDGLYWSSTLIESDPNNAYGLHFYSEEVSWGSNGRVFGLSVRPVRKN